MFTVNNKNTRMTSMISFDNFEHISHLFLALQLLTLNRYIEARKTSIDIVLGFF